MKQLLKHKSKKELNVNKTGYLVVNTSHEEMNILIFNSIEKATYNNSIFDAVQEIFKKKKREKSDVSYSEINNTKITNVIQTYKKSAQNAFQRRLKTDEDRPDYGVNTFAVQEIINNSTLTMTLSRKFYVMEILD